MKKAYCTYYDFPQNPLELQKSFLGNKNIAKGRSRPNNTLYNDDSQVSLNNYSQSYKRRRTEKNAEDFSTRETVCLSLFPFFYLKLKDKITRHIAPYEYVLR